MNATSPSPVASLLMYPFRYSRSTHSTSSVTCPARSSGIVAIPRFYGMSPPHACRFEVADLASLYLSSHNIDNMSCGKPMSEYSVVFRFGSTSTASSRWTSTAQQL
jgi:hypothetical protein